MTNDYKDLEDYGVIGNLETCTIIGRDGSIDWLCFPYLESASVFAAILDVNKGGHFRISPYTKYSSFQSYIEGTNILQTTFICSMGTAAITDFMPVKKADSDKYTRLIFRKVQCVKGEIELELNFKPRFDYARAIPVFKQSDGGILAGWKNESLFLQSPIPITIREGEAQGAMLLKAGESAWFVLQYNHHEIIPTENCDEILKETEMFWHDWARKCIPSMCVLNEPWEALLIRSGLLLKLLTNPETGANAAAATTSLPEKIGGIRNWDYRYAWIRDSAFTVQALFHLGHEKEAQDFRRWMLKIITQVKDPSKIMIMYGVHGEVDLEERTLPHLSGYKNSSPVRIGNGAVKQRQLDIYGELLNALYDITRYGEDIPAGNWKIIRDIVTYVSKIWNTEDSGIWEIRGGPRHFVYSKLMCWVALDRGIKIVKEKKFEAPPDIWLKTEKEIRSAILEKGFSKRLNSFVQSFGSEVLDATSLLIPLMEFLPPDDPKVQGTINGVLKQLTTKNGLVRRYEAEDGFPGREGDFLLCSFWLIKALSISKRIEEAEKIFRNVIKYSSPLGIFTEEIDSETGRQIGNFPQAFSHIGLIDSALYLGIAKGRNHKGPKPVGCSGA